MRKAPVQARAKDRIERVLDAADAVFGKVGYDAATTNQISRQANTSIGSIYEFFEDKTAVAAALCARYQLELTLLLDDILVKQPAAPTQQLSNVVDALADLSARHPGFGPLLRACRSTSELRTARTEIEAVLIKRLETMLTTDRQKIDPPRQHILAKTCVSVLRDVLDNDPGIPTADRNILLAELKLAIKSYLAVSMPQH